MKLLLAATMMIAQLAQAQVGGNSREQIGDWDGALPQAEVAIIHRIEAQAKATYGWQGSNLACGGETSNFVLADYFTYEDKNLKLTHKIKLRLNVTASKYHCEDEYLMECEVPVTIHDAERFVVGQLKCVDL